jgi:hypothetical protein
VVLLVLAIPAALVGFAVATQLLSSIDLPEGIRGLLLLFLPLLVAGLCALPFLIPFVDYKAKQALADRPSREPGDRPGPPAA